jgi:hypothetical protein
MTFIKRDRTVSFVPPSYAYPIEYIERLLNNGGRIVTEKSNGCDFWWGEFGGQKDTINEIASITLELKRLTLGIYNYIKNSGKFEADTLELNWMGSLPGKRESRRFVTEYVLTETDILHNSVFDDVAFHGGWYLDSTLLKEFTAKRTFAPRYRLTFTAFRCVVYFPCNVIISCYAEGYLVPAMQRSPAPESWIRVLFQDKLQALLQVYWPPIS